METIAITALSLSILYLLLLYIAKRHVLKVIQTIKQACLIFNVYLDIFFSDTLIGFRIFKLINEAPSFLFFSVVLIISEKRLPTYKASSFATLSNHPTNIFNFFIHKVQYIHVFKRG